MPRLAITLLLTLAAPAAAGAQSQIGRFEVNAGVGVIFSNAQYVSSTSGLSLGAGYAFRLSNPLGLMVGATANVGDAADVTPVCLPEGGSCGASTLLPGNLYGLDTQFLVSPWGLDRWLRFGAGPGWSWASDLSGGNNTSFTATGRADFVLPVRWPVRPIIGLRATHVFDPIGVVEWYGGASLGVTF